MQKLLVALTLVNLALLGFLLTRVPAAAVADSSGVLRGRALQITDDHGRVRASIVVHGPSSPGASETVVLRLVDPNGRPSVKIAGSESSAGLSFVGESDSAHVILKAEGPDTSLKLATKDGRQQVIKP
jgi:hypothetical protein